MIQAAPRDGIDERETSISSTPRFTQLDWIGLGGLTVLGLLLRIWGIQNESAWYDEILSLRHLHEPNLLAFLRSLNIFEPPLSPSFHPMMPLYFTLEYLVSRLSGESVIAIRLLSVMISVLSIPIMALLGLRVFGRRAGLFAALYMTLSLSQIYHAQEVRMYGLMTLLSLISLYLTAAHFEKPRARWWVLIALVNASLLWCHIYGIWLIMAETVFLSLIAKPYRRPFFPWLILHGILAIPWLIYVQKMDFSQMGNQMAWVQTPSPKLLYDIYLFIIGVRIETPVFPLIHPPSPVFESLLGWRADFTGCVYAILIAYGVGMLLSRSSDVSAPTPSTMTPRVALLFALTLGLLPIILLTAISFFRPCLIDRYVMNSSIELCLLCGAGTALISRKGIRTAVALLLVVCYGVSFAATPRPARGNWSIIGEQIQRESREDDVIALVDEKTFIIMNYHTPQLRDRMIILHTSEDFLRTEEETRRACRDLWVGLINMANPASQGALDFFSKRSGAQITQIKFDQKGEWVFLHIQQPCHY